MAMPKGFKHSEATKAKMRASHRGVKFSDERRASMKAAAKRREARRRKEEAALRARLKEYERLGRKAT